jgi:pimeloyl-ACP methyl ester carboxylesterase
MRTADLNGTTISYADTGGADKPAIVLSHGFLMDHTMFDAQVSALAPDHRVITWDERGFGGTRATGDFTYWDSARDVLALLDHLGIESAVIGGMSQGGFLSLRVALLAPERVRGLVLIDTQAGTEDPATVEPYNALHATWLEHGPAPVQEIIAGLILGPGEWPQWYEKWANLEPDQFTAAFRCLMHRDDITDRLGEITAPALVIHGTADAAIPVSKAEALRDGLGGRCDLVLVDGAPHAANITHSDRVNAAISAFLGSLS